MHKAPIAGLKYADLTEQSQFWIVFNPKAIDSRPPKKLYPKLKAAMDDADTLAKANPGDHFFVMQPIGCSFIPGPPKPVEEPELVGAAVQG